MDKFWNLDFRDKFAKGFTKQGVQFNHLPHLQYYLKEIP
jgi:hypothetical protein